MSGAPYKFAKEEVGALSSVPRLTMKEHPCHVYSDLVPSKQITGQTMYSGVASTFEVKS